MIELKERIKEQGEECQQYFRRLLERNLTTDQLEQYEKCTGKPEKRVHWKGRAKIDHEAIPFGLGKEN